MINHNHPVCENSEMTLSDTENLKAYSSFIDKAASDNKPDYIANIGVDYAAAMLSVMFNHAQNEILMIVGRFSGNVSNHKNYYDALMKALNKKVNAKVIVLNPPNEDAQSFKLLKKYHNNFPDRVEIRLGNNDTKNVLLENIQTTSQDPAHFAVIDEKNTRLETNPREYAGIGIFNDNDYGQKMKNIFNKAYKTAIAL